MRVGSITVWNSGSGILVEIVVKIDGNDVWRRKHWISITPYRHNVGYVNIRDLEVIS